MPLGAHYLNCRLVIGEDRTFICYTGRRKNSGDNLSCSSPDPLNGKYQPGYAEQPYSIWGMIMALYTCLTNLVPHVEDANADKADSRFVAFASTISR